MFLARLCYKSEVCNECIAKTYQIPRNCDFSPLCDRANAWESMGIQLTKTSFSTLTDINFKNRSDGIAFMTIPEVISIKKFRKCMTL